MPKRISAESRRVWTHNSYSGMARMMEVNAATIQRADSTTPETKRIARDIEWLARQLKAALKTRVD